MECEYLPDELRAEEFLSLRAVSGLKPIDIALVRAALGKSIVTIKAVLGGELAGFARVAGDGALVFIVCDVLVHPALRCKGIGSQLVRRTMDELARRIPRGTWVQVSLFPAPGRDGFYRRLGFSPNEGIGPSMHAYITNPG